MAGHCYARAGRARESIDAMRAAVRRDPRNWRYHYGLEHWCAPMLASTRAALPVLPLRRNPLEPLTGQAASRFGIGGRAPGDAGRENRADTG